MPDRTFYTNEGAHGNATRQQTAEAASKVRLFKSGFTPTPATPKADLVAQECDFSGYTAGGNAIAAFLNPILAPEGGYSIQSPLTMFVTADPTTVGNIVGGFWLELAGGDVVLVTVFEVPIPMSTPNQGIPISIRQLFGN